MRKRKNSGTKKSKKATSRKAGLTVRARTRAKIAAPIKEIAFDDWVETIRTLHDVGAEFEIANRAMLNDDEPSVGACLVRDPDGGGRLCVQTTAAACKAMGGTYRGGACGG